MNEREYISRLNEERNNESFLTRSQDQRYSIIDRSRGQRNDQTFVTRSQNQTRPSVDQKPSDTLNTRQNNINKSIENLTNVNRSLVDVLKQQRDVEERRLETERRTPLSSRTRRSSLDGVYNRRGSVEGRVADPTRTRRSLIDEDRDGVYNRRGSVEGRVADPTRTRRSLIDEDQNADSQFSTEQDVRLQETSWTQPVRLTDDDSELTHSVKEQHKELLSRKRKEHAESISNLRNIANTIVTTSGDVRGTIIDSLMMQYHEFMRHPFYNTVRMAMKPLTKLTGLFFSGVRRLLFGRRKSDTEKIVDSIKEQTEVIQTGTATGPGLFEKGLLTTLGSEFWSSFKGSIGNVLERARTSLFGEREEDQTEFKELPFLQQQTRLLEAQVNFNKIYLNKLDIIEQSLEEIATYNQTQVGALREQLEFSRSRREQPSGIVLNQQGEQEKDLSKVFVSKEERDVRQSHLLRQEKSIEQAELLEDIKGILKEDSDEGGDGGPSSFLTGGAIGALTAFAAKALPALIPTIMAGMSAYGFYRIARGLFHDAPKAVHDLLTGEYDEKREDFKSGEALGQSEETQQRGRQGAFQQQERDKFEKQFMRTMGRAPTNEEIQQHLQTTAPEQYGPTERTFNARKWGMKVAGDRANSIGYSLPTVPRGRMTNDGFEVQSRNEEQLQGIVDSRSQVPISNQMNRNQQQLDQMINKNRSQIPISAPKLREERPNIPSVTPGGEQSSGPQEIKFSDENINKLKNALKSAIGGENQSQVASQQSPGLDDLGTYLITIGR